MVLSGTAQFISRLDQRLDPELAGTQIWVRGTISSLPQVSPDHVRFNFRPDERQAQLARIPETIQVRWYRQEVIPEPGEAWALKLRIRPPRGTVNFQGGDSERFYLGAGLGALATVLDARRLNLKSEFTGTTHSLRAKVRKHIQSIVSDSDARALLLSLAIADRSELDSSDWSVLRATGTGHLLAISGLHIGLAAVMGFWLFRGFLWVLPGGFARGYAGFTLSCAASLVVAAAYGVLAGFPVSTVRALGMLAVVTLVLRCSIHTHPLGAWALAFVIVSALNPFAFLSAGFWLSFGAVVALILFFTPRFGVEHWLTRLPRAQFAVMAITLPLGAFWFQAGSWLSLPANLVSIPWVSLVSVPLTLASVIATPFSWLFSALIQLAALSCELLWIVLVLLSQLGNAVLTPAIGLAGVVIGVLGGLLLLLPTGIFARWLGLGLLAMMILPREAMLKHGEYSVEVLDVGQGLAVNVTTRNHSLLYDTGPGDGVGWSTVGSVIAPALASDGKEGPDLIIVSHADLDHAGGLNDIETHYPGSKVLLNDTHEESLNECRIGQSWTWDGVSFEVLHPSGWLPYLGNDSSCVISIDNGVHKTLLTGDIGKGVEARLLDSIGEHQFMTVPHHGSTSSSSEAFLRAVNPSLAVVSASYGNRFGFPRSEVITTYERLNIPMLSTIDCGAIRVHFPVTGEAVMKTARIDARKPWRWRPNPEDCMVRPQPSMYHLKRPKNKE